MSMAIKRLSYTGDPGLFGDIFGGIKGAIGGAFKGFTGIGVQPPRPIAGPGSFPLPPMFGPPVPAPGVLPAIQRALPGGASGMMAGCAPMSGYHLNKSEYFLKSGEFVPEGSRLVRNRKRNPANARATSRAISRIVGAKNYAKSLSRVSIRKHSHK